MSHEDLRTHALLVHDGAWNYSGHFHDPDKGCDTHFIICDTCMYSWLLPRDHLWLKAGDIMAPYDLCLVCHVKQSPVDTLDRIVYDDD